MEKFLCFLLSPYTSLDDDNDDDDCCGLRKEGKHLFHSLKGVCIK